MCWGIATWCFFVPIGWPRYVWWDVHRVPPPLPSDVDEEMSQYTDDSTARQSHTRGNDSMGHYFKVSPRWHGTAFRISGPLCGDSSGSWYKYDIKTILWSRALNIISQCYFVISFTSTVCVFARFRWITLQWRHNGRDSVSNHQPHDCLLNRLFGRISKKTPKLRVTGLCAGNSPWTGEFPAQMASNAENVSIWWRHHETQSTASVIPNQSPPFLKHEGGDGTPTSVVVCVPSPPLYNK